MIPPIPASWQPVVGSETQKPYFKELAAFVAAEQAKGPVYPPAEDIFRALELTPYDRVRVVLLGQDPYHGNGQAHGLAFSVRPGVKPPPSLVNMFKELADDQGVPFQKSNGFLEPWARQGVLLLNTVLTVRAGEANSHKGRGWEAFTDAVIRAVSAKPDPVVFLLWGAHAQKKLELIDATRHAVIKGAHPSPFSAANGFFGTKPFGTANARLKEMGKPPIDWKINAAGKRETRNSNDE